VRALSTISITSGSTQNKNCGILKMFTMDRPWSLGDHRCVNFFYQSTNGKSPLDPSTALVCNYAKSESLPCSRFQSDVALGSINVDQTKPMHEGVTPQKTKMSHQFDTTAVTPMRDTEDNVERDDVDNNISLMEETTDKAQVQTRSVYWNSIEAAKLFGCIHGEDVFDCLVTRVKQLTSALQCSEAYKIIVDGGGEHMSQHDIFTIHNKCVFLRLAYIYAIES
jgi:hypothetical protein